MIEGKKKRKHQTMQAVPISFSGKKTTEKLGKRHGNVIFIRKLIAFLCKILRFIGSVELYMFIEELGNCLKVIMDKVFFEIFCSSIDFYHLVNVLGRKFSFAPSKKSHLVIRVHARIFNPFAENDVFASNPIPSSI